MYAVRTVGHQLPCAAGTYRTQEAGTRSPYVQLRRPRDVRVNTGVVQAARVVELEIDKGEERLLTV